MQCQQIVKERACQMRGDASTLLMNHQLLCCVNTTALRNSYAHHTCAGVKSQIKHCLYMPPASSTKSQCKTPTNQPSVSRPSMISYGLSSKLRDCCIQNLTGSTVYLVNPCVLGSSLAIWPQSICPEAICPQAICPDAICSQAICPEAICPQATSTMRPRAKASFR